MSSQEYLNSPGDLMKVPGNLPKMTKDEIIRQINALYESTRDNLYDRWWQRNTMTSWEDYWESAEYQGTFKSEKELVEAIESQFKE